MNFSNTISLKNELILGASGSLLIKIANRIIVFLTSILLARLLGVTGFGFYSFILSIVQILAVISMMGWPQLIVREISSFHANHLWSPLHGIIKKSFLSTIILSTCIAIVAAILAPYLSFEKTTEVTPAFWIALLMIPLISLINVWASVLRGLKKIVVSLFLLENVPPFLFLLSICILYTLVKSISVFPTIFVQTISFCVSGILIFMLMNRQLPSEVKKATPIYYTKDWVTSSTSLLLAQLMFTLNSHASIILLGTLVSSDSVGIFRVALGFSELIPIGLIGLNAALAPTAASLFVKGELKRLQNIVSKSTRAIFLFTLPIVLVLAFGGRNIITLFYGKSYIHAYSPLAILCIAQLFNVGSGSVGMLLNMSGNEKDTVRGVSLAALINVILNFLLIPQLGVVGAAIASGTSLIILNVMLAKLLFKKTGIHATLWPRLSAHRKNS